MERKQFINQLLVGGSGLLISSTFLYGCFKTDSPHPPPSNRPAPFIPGDIFLLASNIQLIRDEAFEKKFHCQQIATGTLLSIIRKAPFPFDRHQQRRVRNLSLQRGQAKPFSVSYHYSHQLASEYAITDVRRVSRQIKVPVVSGPVAHGAAVVRLLDYQGLDRWFDQDMIDLITH